MSEQLDPAEQALLFLDLESVVRKPKSGELFVQSAQDQQLREGAADILDYASELCLTCVSFSNQGGIAHGYKTLDDVEQELAFLASLHPQLQYVVLCPDDGASSLVFDAQVGLQEGAPAVTFQCANHRKPSAGMICAAREAWGGRPIGLIGKGSSEQMARAVGISYMEASEALAHPTWIDGLIDPSDDPQSTGLRGACDRVHRPRKHLPDKHIAFDRHTPLEDRQVLCCPRCGSTYLHHQSLRVYQRDAEDSETGVLIDTAVAQPVQPNASMDGNPSGRRNGFEIIFHCEECSRKNEDPIMLCTVQHKGQTMLWWEYPPLPVRRRARRKPIGKAKPNWRPSA